MSFQGKIVAGDGTLIATVDGKSYTIPRNHAAYSLLKEAFINNDSEAFVANVSFKHVADNYVSTDSDGNETGITLGDDGQVYFNGEALHNSVTATIKRMFAEGFDIEPMVNFLTRLMDNPSRRSVEELFTFLESCGLTITEDGCFLAYKTVRDNYMDKYSGKFDNSPGAVNSMPRNQVDDDFRNTCSIGFHVGALAYAGPGGWYNSEDDKVVIVKVAPEDVVSVPLDHSGQKLRTCAYEVVGDFQGELKSSVYSGEVHGDYSSNVATPRQMEEDEPEFISDPDDMLIDSEYSFFYNKSGAPDGWERRVIVVTGIDDNHVYGMLLPPETHAGEHRAFRKDRMDDEIEVLESASYDDEPEENDDPWMPW